MNKFVKFPLVLGIVGIICTGALSVVYEVTKDKIAYNKNKVAIDLMSGIVEDISNAEPVLEKYDVAKAESVGVKNMYEVSNSQGVCAYGYLAEVTGYNPGINFLLVLDDTEPIIVGFSVVSHQETNSGSYGGPLLNSPDFASQFTGIGFDEVGSKVDYVAGSTAKVTMGAVKAGVDNVISFHKQAVLGETDDGINLTSTERQMLGLAEGSVMTDKTEEFKTTLKGKVSANVYKNIMEQEVVEKKEYTKIWNYIEIADAKGTVKGHAYVVQGNYNCEVEHGKKSWQEHKFVFMFDENGANVNVVVVNSTDSLGATTMDSKAIENWLDANYNGKTVTQINDILSGEGGIDFIHGATFTSTYLRNHIGHVINAHTRAYGK
jgi:Na+-translocating ferredoxin:NAD+ oxidoreductase RnfG subunit